MFCCISEVTPFRVRRKGVLEIILFVEGWIMKSLIDKNVVNKVMPILLFCFLTSGCTKNLKEFQEMSAYKRADYVCDSEPRLASIKSKFESLFHSIQQKKHLLAQGYRIHKSCQEVALPSSSQEVTCKSNPTFGGAFTTSCAPKGLNFNAGKTKKVCTNTPVPIDTAYESSQLIILEKQAARVKKLKNTYHKDCYKKVNSMSADQAFTYFKSF